MSPLFLVFMFAASTYPPALHHFTNEDTNNNGILTTNQFIEGLISAFTQSHFEKDLQSINDFGREFAGRKKTKGFIKISDIKSWLDSQEIYDAYKDWKYIIEEGEAHLSPNHDHKFPQKSSKLG